MPGFRTRFSNRRQDWETPDEIFEPLAKEFKIVLDVCATNENHKCATWFTKEQNGLLQDWSTFSACWMNPPFGNQSKWVRKAYKESQKGTTVVCLLPCRTNTNWWHDYCMKGEIRFIRGRPVFKGAKYGLPLPLAIVIFKSPGIVSKL